MAADRELDALVIGAGLAGLYQLHLLREQGLRVRAYDAADDVGGTWWWNAYPGARVDTEGREYQYLFSEQLYTDWSWSERFPAGYEVLRWMRFVADRLDLRRDIALSTRIVGAHYDEARGRWTVRTDRGDTIDTQFLVSCAGALSAPREDAIDGRERFAGPVVHTARWPRPGPDLDGRRVGVVGIGATGVQVIPALADRADHLTVFARTPQYVLPLANAYHGWQDRDAYKTRLAELRDAIRHTASGFAEDPPHVWATTTPEDRRAILEELYRDGSAALWRAGFRELPHDEEVAGAVSEFVRAKMRERLADPRLIDVLVPTDHLIGTRHVPLECGYLEVYHREDVDLVGVRDNPITRIRPEGLELADGTVHALDAIVLATGFDAGTGALRRVDVRGRDGRSLAQEWGRDVRTTMGLAKHGFPNLFTTGAPLAPAAGLGNMATCLPQQAEWIAGAIRDLRAAGLSTIEPTAQAEDAWVAHHDVAAAATLLADSGSWFRDPSGRLLPYPGGVGAYRRRCDEEAAGGYPAFTTI